MRVHRRINLNSAVIYDAGSLRIIISVFGLQVTDNLRDYIIREVIGNFIKLVQIRINDVLDFNGFCFFIFSIRNVSLVVHEHETCLNTALCRIVPYIGVIAALFDEIRCIFCYLVCRNLQNQSV